MAQVFSNSASSLLVNSITTVTTTLLVSAGTGDLFPDIGSGPDYFVATLEDSGGNFEIVRCTARTGDALTVVRGQEFTTPQNFAAGDRLELRLTAGAIGVFMQREDDVIDGGTF